MVAELLSHLNGSFTLPKILGIHFSFTTKIPGDTLLSKMPAELPSTEQILTETSRFGFFALRITILTILNFHVACLEKSVTNTLKHRWS